MTTPSLFSLFAIVPVDVDERMRQKGWELIRGNLRPDEIFKYLVAARPSHCTELESALSAVVEAGKALIEYLDDEPPKKHPFGSYPGIEARLRDALARLETLASQAGKGKI